MSSTFWRLDDITFESFQFLFILMGLNVATYAVRCAVLQVVGFLHSLFCFFFLRVAYIDDSVVLTSLESRICVEIICEFTRALNMTLLSFLFIAIACLLAYDLWSKFKN
jgi:hypothetical protein